MPQNNCPKCNVSFTSQQLVAKHSWERHTEYASCVSLDNSTFSLKRTDDGFLCLCKEKKSFQTCSGFQKHVRSGRCSVIASVSFQSANVDIDDCASDEDLDEKIISHTKTPARMQLPSIDWNGIASTTRDYCHAILHACNATDWRQEEQSRLLTIMDSYGLRPISLAAEGVEENALTHENNLITINQTQFEVSATPPPKKRKRQASVTTVTASASLYSSVVSGPYSKRFLSYNYVEMTSEIANFLNQDWLIHPQMRYACSRLLAGAILIDSLSGKSIVVNSVEVYGRTRSLDSHRESFRTRSGGAPASSLPPETTRYPNIWPTTMSDSDGEKLVIGTKTFNALVTSSLRLDDQCQPEVGPSTRHFVLETSERSLDTRIFVKESAWMAAVALANDLNTNQITNYDMLYQLRQLRTRFHHESTYLRCRASNELTDDVTTRPYTLFTLADWDGGKDESGYRVGSKIFQLIGTNVVLGRNELLKDRVLGLERKLDGKTEMGRHFKTVLGLFGEEDRIDIIGNSELNTCLEKIAGLLSAPITKANQSVKLAILSSFSS